MRRDKGPVDTAKPRAGNKHAVVTRRFNQRKNNNFKGFRKVNHTYFPVVIRDELKAVLYALEGMGHTAELNGLNQLLRDKQGGFFIGEDDTFLGASGKDEQGHKAILIALNDNPNIAATIVHELCAVMGQTHKQGEHAEELFNRYTHFRNEYIDRPEDDEEPTESLFADKKPQAFSVGGFKGFRRVEDNDALSRQAAEQFFYEGQQAIHDHGWFNVMLIGGITPQGMYELLTEQADRTVQAEEPIAGGGFVFRAVPFWSRVRVFWTNDARPITPRRDTTTVILNHLIEVLNLKGAKLQEGVHYFVLSGKNQDLQAEALRYERLLRKELKPFGGRPDFILSSANHDGQIFGITPQSAAVREVKRWVVVNQTAKGPWLTITPALLFRARSVIVLMGENHKQIPLVNLLMEKGFDVDMPIRLVRQIRERVTLIVDQKALSWHPFEATRRDGVVVLSDYREGMDPRGPIGIGVHGFMGSGSFANLAVSFFLRSNTQDKEIIDGSFLAVHRGSGDYRRVIGYMPCVRSWLKPDERLLGEFAEGVEATVAKSVEDEIARYGKQSRFIYIVNHSNGNPITKILYANPQKYPYVNRYVRAHIYGNPFILNPATVFRGGIVAIEKVLPRVPPAVRQQLEVLLETLRLEKHSVRDGIYRYGSRGFFYVLSLPAITYFMRLLKNRWKSIVGDELILPSIEEMGLPLEFFPAVSEAYRRISPEVFIRELHAVIRADPAIEREANRNIRKLIKKGKLRVLVVGDPDDPVVGYEGVKESAKEMGAELVELRMRDHMHLLKSEPLKIIGLHMTHMFHPEFVRMGEAFLRGQLVVDRNDPYLWEIDESLPVDIAKPRERRANRSVDANRSAWRS